MSLIQLFKNLKPYVYPYRWLVVLALVLTLIGSLTAQVNAWVLRYAVDEINALVEAHKGLQEGFSILVTISVILISKEVINSFIQFGQKFYGEKLRIFIAKDLAQAVIDKVLTYKLAFFTSGGNQPGKLQTRIDRGVESLTRLVQNFFIDILPLFANSIVALLMMFNANFYVGLVGLCIIPIYYIVSRQQAIKMSGSRRNIKELRENKSQGILGILESITVIKSFIRENIESDKQMSLQNHLTDEQMKTRKMSFLFDGLKSFIDQIGIVFIIILTAYFVLIGNMTIGAIMFHIMLFNNVSAPIRQLHRIYDQMNDALIYSEGFFDILKADHQIEHSGDYRGHIRGKFKIRNVNFTYPDNEVQTLYDINMEINPGQTTALVGLSGAGKSTLINLLDKFYSPDSGEILLDGVSLEKYDTAYLRENIGLVLQKNHIFNGTIEENIRYGKPNATEAEVIDAAKKSYIHDQIITFENGYQTSALALSGGQQQKIAIARMFLKNPPIIFLDEPTASLDAVATEQIKNSLDAIKKDRTVIIISHSISQIIDSDCIFVMKNGRVVESGTHDEIYHQEGTYKEIFDAMARSLNIDKISKTLDD
ncbi:ABC-type multidrug transport system fused ATPase/permease subunit [Dysgonomonas hofstadii]|uniref:ABC-type multidrug transport system fused ATPase/permease subunit n=1 Tax=Dysgonomonas hofstadii TaxID=637886 RepID=A0A840CUB8_9BACT|nr:ABC transporter ATP-binding protein [Dysgonomonas hofstadii]MBB4035303.1 ABC-type multidrug transport system fused ATPase/permease subunit [Dysgonomonas hofstadii]